MRSPRIVKALIAPHELRQDDIIPALVPMREYEQRALSKCPYHERHKHHPKATQRQDEEASISTGGEPGHGEKPRRPHRQNTLPDATVDGGFIACDQVP